MAFSLSHSSDCSEEVCILRQLHVNVFTSLEEREHERNHQREESVVLVEKCFA